jgi:hypothetical protein
LDNKRVLGPKKDVVEILNAIDVCDKLSSYRSTNQNTFLKTHIELMKGLVNNQGAYRKKSVGIVQGSDVALMSRHLLRRFPF